MTQEIGGAKSTRTPVKKARTEGLTEAELKENLSALGVRSGSPLVVHSSLSALGWVEGGAETVIRALISAVGKSGTLAMPAATPQCAIPSTEGDLSESSSDVGEDLAPLFDPRATPTRMGAIAEAFRSWPGTRRSDHPLEAVCARGPIAEELVSPHPWDFSEGPGTPFGRLYDAHSDVLLLGVGFNRCTALHFAETLSPNRRTAGVCFVAFENGKLRRIHSQNVADDNGRLFPRIGQQFLEQGQAIVGKVGNAESILFSMHALVEQALCFFDNAE